MEGGEELFWDGEYRPMWEASLRDSPGEGILFSLSMLTESSSSPPSTLGDMRSLRGSMNPFEGIMCLAPPVGAAL